MDQPEEKKPWPPETCEYCGEGDFSDWKAYVAHWAHCPGEPSPFLPLAGGGVLMAD